MAFNGTDADPAPAPSHESNSANIIAIISLVLTVVFAIGSVVVSWYTVQRSKTEFSLLNRAILSCEVHLDLAAAKNQPVLSITLRALGGVARVSKAYLCPVTSLHPDTQGDDLKVLALIDARYDPVLCELVPHRKRTKFCCGSQCCQPSEVAFDLDILKNAEDCTGSGLAINRERSNSTYQAAAQRLVNMDLASEPVPLLEIGLRDRAVDKKDIQDHIDQLEQLLEHLSDKSLLILYQSKTCDSWHYAEATRFSFNIKEELRGRREALSAANKKNKKKLSPSISPTAPSPPKSSTATPSTPCTPSGSPTLIAAPPTSQQGNP